MKTYEIISKFEGEEYFTFLECMKSVSDEFSLTVRDSFEHNVEESKLLNRLTRFLIQEKRTNFWPGTELCSDTARVFKYRTTEDSINSLFIVRSPWELIDPEFPEDLAFYKKGSVIFESISHENLAFLKMSQELIIQFEKYAPLVKIIGA